MFFHSYMIYTLITAFLQFYFKFAILNKKLIRLPQLLQRIFITFLKRTLRLKLKVAILFPFFGLSGNAYQTEN